MKRIIVYSKLLTHRAWRRCVKTRRRRTIVFSAIAILSIPFLAWSAFESAVVFWPYPEQLKSAAPAACLEDRTGKPLAMFAASDGQWRLPLEEAQISPHLLDAMVAVEDSRFYAHSGVDWESAAGAAIEDLHHLRIRRGGSTITMQLQNLRQPRPRTFFNKIVQGVRATQIERRQTKQQILVEYVNRAPFGGNLVGVGAASRRYFDKPCAQLSLAEAALLAGLPQSPNRLRPDRFPKRARARRDHVLERMLASGFIDRRQFEEALAEPVAAAWHELPQARSNAGQIPADGALPALLDLAAHHPGQTVRTTLDAGIQREVSAAAVEHLHRLETNGVNAIAVVVLDTNTANCLATVSLGAQAPWLDLSRTTSSTGSTLKPFIYAAAFDAGVLGLRTVLEDSPATWAGYSPADYDRKFRGQLSAAEALAESRNIPAMRVLSDLGVASALGVMQSAGLKTLAQSSKDYGLSLAVGGANASAWELAQAYAMLARGGTTRDATILCTGQGDSLSSPGATRCLREAACWQTLAAIAGADRTAGVCPEAAATNVAWKTGTSSGHRDAWCAATTRNRTIVVWIGNTAGEGSAALVGQEAAAPLALRLIALLDREPHDPWPAVLENAPEPIRRAPAADGRLTLVCPRPNEQFVLNDEVPADRQRILLRAQLPGLARRRIWWFVDEQPLGEFAAGEPVWWTPTVGSHSVRAVDNAGISAGVRIVVR